MDGLDVIATIIHRYIVVEAVYRHKNTSPSRADDTSTQAMQLFEEALITLYSKILEYEARAACKFYQHRFKQFLRDAVKIDNLDSLLIDIKTADSDCQQYLPILDSRLLAQEYKNQAERHKILLGAFESHMNELQSTAADTLQVLKDNHFTEIQRDQTKQERKCLRVLRGSLDYEENKNRNPTAMPNTCRWVLENTKFLDWRNGKTSGLLWISADPGCGKSVLSRSLVDCVLVGRPKQIVCYFFFKHDSDSKTSDALCALLHQAFSVNPALVKYALPYFESNGPQLARLVHTLWNILVEVATDPGVDEFVCILDALDECQNPKSIIWKLTEFFSPAGSRENQQALSKIKFLFTSRPYTSLERGEKGLGTLLRSTPEIRISGDEECETIQEEIAMYVRHQSFLISEELGLDGQTKIYLEERLLSMQNRTYLWLYLVLEDLRNSDLGTTTKSLEKIINTLPPTVDAAYESILNKSTHPTEAKRLLHVVTGAIRPLTVAETRVVLAIDRQSHSFADLNLDDLKIFEKLIRNRCGHFIKISEGKIFLIHQTAKDFLIRVDEMSQTANSTKENLQTSWKHSIVPSESHRILAQACISYLCFAEFESAYNGGSDAQSLGSKASDEDPCDSQDSMTVYDPRHWQAEYIKNQCKKHELLDYASFHWVAHHNLAGADPRCLEDAFFWRLCDPKSSFCRNWFEIVDQQDLGIEIFYSNRLTTSKQDSAFLFCCFIGLVYGVKSLAKNTSTDIKVAAFEFAIEGGAGINIIHLINPSGTLKIDSELLRLCPDNSKFQGLTALRLAVHKRDLQLMRYFLRIGANPNYRGSQHHTTILHDALEVGREKTAMMVKLLLEKGAHVNALTNLTTGASPLYFALALSLPKDVCDLLRNADGESQCVDDPRNVVLLTGIGLGI